ncbi:hypothetical protein [Streptomyces oceani]|uniref:hypothetical protein n=1 Tax=Streptomyces oceani TaxID=1075402 RepID=UPI0008727DCF|nr:hypothetical protein [Streptomyces oceani]
MSGQRYTRQTLLMRAAYALGLQVHDRMPETGSDLVTYSDGSTHVTVLEGRYDDRLRARDFFLTEDKRATKALLDSAGFTTPRGGAFMFASTDPDPPNQAADADRAWRFATETMAALHGRPVVVKPRAGMHGEAVRTDVRTPEAAVAHLLDWRHAYADWLIEEQVDGPDLRIQLIGEELVAACTRRPAFVTGDAQHALGELIERRRAQVEGHNPNNSLRVDAETESLLAAQGLTLGEVPAAGRTVWLKQTANMTKGGVAIDVTGSLHPGFHEWAAGAAKLFDAEIIALDAVCAAPHEPPEESVTILEVNAAPEWTHHTFSEHRTHDIATRVLRFWFGL